MTDGSASRLPPPQPEYADDATALSELRVELATWCRLHHVCNPARARRLFRGRNPALRFFAY